MSHEGVSHRDLERITDSKYYSPRKGCDTLLSHRKLEALDSVLVLEGKYFELFEGVLLQS